MKLLAWCQRESGRGRGLGGIDEQLFGRAATTRRICHGGAVNPLLPYLSTLLDVGAPYKRTGQLAVGGVHLWRVAAVGGSRRRRQRRRRCSSFRCAVFCWRSCSTHLAFVCLLTTDRAAMPMALRLGRALPSARAVALTDCAGGMQTRYDADCANWGGAAMPTALSWRRSCCRHSAATCAASAGLWHGPTGTPTNACLLLCLLHDASRYDWIPVCCMPLVM